MFGWFKRKQNHDDPSVYSTTERAIYRYTDGSKMVTADPLVLVRKLMEIQPELAVDIKVAHSPSKDNLKAHVEMIAKLRNLFGVKPIEDGGLTESQLLDLFNHFLEYIDAVKKNSPNSATPPAATSATSEISSVESPPTPSFSECGSAATEHPTGGPGKFPSEPPSPSVWSGQESITTAP